MNNNPQSNSVSLGLIMILITILTIIASYLGGGGFDKQISTEATKQIFTPSPVDSGSNSSQPFDIYGYYPYWKHTEFPLSKIQASLFDGLSQAFIWPDAAGNIVLPKGLASREFIRSFSASGKTMTISVGGWQRSSGFDRMTDDPAILAEFVKNLARYVKDNGYGGVNIDWEYPEGQEHSKTLARLGEEIRKALPDTLVTVSLPMIPSIHKMNVDVIHPAFDQVHIMAYDIESGWGGYGGYNAPLHPNPSMPRDLSIEALLQTEYLDLGVPKEKIVLGLPLYGRKYNTPDPYGPINDSEPVEYKNLPFKLCAKETKEGTSGPLLKCPGYYISYDDIESIREKIAFAKKSGFRGVFFWALGQDNNQLVDELGLKNTESEK